MRIQAWASRSIERERKREDDEESTFIEWMAADSVKTVLTSFFVFIFFGFKDIAKTEHPPPDILLDPRRTYKMHINYYFNWKCTILCRSYSAVNGIYSSYMLKSNPLQDLTINGASYNLHVRVKTGGRVIFLWIASIVQLHPALKGSLQRNQLNRIYIYVST